MSERIKTRLGVETSKLAVNTDTYLKVNLEGKERLLPPGEINNIVNVGERFNVERQRSKFYRVLGTINPMSTNVLFNLSDTSTNGLFTWSGFNDIKFVDRSYPYDNDVNDADDITYSQSIKTNLKEVNGWFGYTNPDISQAGLCEYIDVEPKRERFSFVGAEKNWELTITYPKSEDRIHEMVNGGLLITDGQIATVSERPMVALGTTCLHNLEIGSSVRITGTNGYDGDHVVVRTGLDNGDLKGYYFVIDIPFSQQVTPTSRLKRIFGGEESEYYFRLFTKVATRNTIEIEPDDYETYKLAFSDNVYTDDISQFVFNEDINVSGLTDNLGRPVSELYLTAIKNDSNGMFSVTSAGIETPYMDRLVNSGTNTYLQDVPAIGRIHNGGASPFQSHKALTDTVKVTDNLYYGDLVEYNKLEVKETVLADVQHRFNTLNRQTQSPLTYVSTTGANPDTTTIDLGPRQEGYFYKAHNLIRIRDFSNYIELGDNFTEGIPDYAESLPDGRYLWRDLLDIGFNESSDEVLNYPFLNGCHYMYDNYCFHVRREDPFSNWGLYYGKFPADPIGETITDKFTTNSEDDTC